MVRLHTQGLGVRSTSQILLPLERQYYVSSITLRTRRFQSDLNLSGHMESGLAETQPMEVTSHSPMRDST
eukprot:1723-Amphidinium_carterae.1